MIKIFSKIIDKFENSIIQSSIEEEGLFTLPEIDISNDDINPLVSDNTNGTEIENASNSEQVQN